MAEAFVRTIKRDYVRVSPRPDAETVMRQLPAWIAHYNEVTRTRLSNIVHA
jgi:putative transposase